MCVATQTAEEFIMTALRVRDRAQNTNWTLAEVRSIMADATGQCKCTTSFSFYTAEWSPDVLQAFLYIVMCNIVKDKPLDVAFVASEAQRCKKSRTAIMMAANTVWWARDGARRLDGLVHVFITSCLPLFSTFLKDTRKELFSQNVTDLHSHMRQCSDKACITQCGHMPWTCGQVRMLQQTVSKCPSCKTHDMCDKHLTQCQVLLAMNGTSIIYSAVFPTKA